MTDWQIPRVGKKYLKLAVVFQSSQFSFHFSEQRTDILAYFRTKWRLLFTYQNTLIGKLQLNILITWDTWHNNIIIKINCM
jgi:hypothetical protein